MALVHCIEFENFDCSLYDRSVNLFCLPSCFGDMLAEGGGCGSGVMAMERVG